ncbi:hypothetical protein AAFF_G00147920 [Aldrovandia affinis]|uniref:PiggyBac transposable element-derived protein domain-containing protein n=1 Tax=Aldrovandia affinis TaxID=143900 RepID=A0AAD7W8L2_9TELE|nr:hypothetical protein AAFF_G00147920 [Aldrovandia affinis]
MQVYTGKPTSGGPEKNQGMRVVLDVTEGLRGHNVTCDNFFTSYELGQQLLKRKITMVGTVRKNKPELPPALLASKEREVFSSKFAFTPTTTLVSYLPKKNKNVVLLSTLHTEADISDREDRKPAIILDYNCNKGGVDNLSKVIGTYSCRRMTAHWPLVIFHNIIDVSSYNAIVIWREINPTWMPRKRNKRRVFLEQLGKALVTPLIERREHLPRTEASAAVVKAVQRPRSRDQPEVPAAPATAPAGAKYEDIGRVKHARQLLEDKKSGKLEVTKEKLEQHIKGQYSDPARNNPLVPLGHMPHPAPPTSQFNIMLPKFCKVREVVKKARSASAPGPNGVPYKLYKNCPGMLKILWTLMRKNN